MARPIDATRRRKEEGQKIGAAQSLGGKAAEGRPELLHNITKPRPWRGGSQVIEDVSEDAQPLKREEVKWQKWKERRVNTTEQVLDDRPWESDALPDLEEALPLMRTEDSTRPASNWKASTGVGTSIPK